MLGFSRVRDIRQHITRRIDLRERALHMGLVGDREEKGSAREGRDASVGEE